LWSAGVGVEATAAAQSGTKAALRKKVRYKSDGRRPLTKFAQIVRGLSVLDNGINQCAAVPLVSSNGLHTGLVYACALRSSVLAWSLYIFD